MTVSRGKKTFLFESKNWNLFQERCTIRCTIRYRYVLIYFRQFYNRRKNLLTLIRFQNHEKKPLHRLTSLKREKTFVWLKKVKVISRCNVFLPFVMNLDLYIHISGNFIMQKILQKSLGGNFTFATTQYTHLVFIIALYPFSAKIQNLKKKNLILTCMGNKLSKNQMVLQYSLHRYSQ